MKAIMCICALALLFEAVVGGPFDEMEAGEDVFDNLDLTKRTADLFLPVSHQLDKRASNLCPVDCFSCFRVIRNLTPDPCVKGCQRRHLVRTDASYKYDIGMWNKCARYLQRPQAT